MDWFLAMEALRMNSLTMLAEEHPVVLVAPPAAVGWGLWYWRSQRSAPRAARVVRCLGSAVLLLGVFFYFDGLRQAEKDCHTFSHDGLCFLIGAFVSEAGAILALAGVVGLVAARVLRGRRAHAAAIPG